MRLIVLRHGRTAWNAQRRFQGQADPPLDEEGLRQAYEVAGMIATLDVDLLVSSDALRAAQTAAPVGDLTGLPVTLDARLRERSLGHWEGLTRDEVRHRYPDEYADWAAGRDVSRRGGESRRQVADRAMAAFSEIAAAGTAVLVTHSATAMALCNSLLGLPHDLHVLGPLANCHWSELRHADGAVWRLRAHNIGAPGPVAPCRSRPSPARTPRTRRRERGAGRGPHHTRPPSERTGSHRRVRATVPPRSAATDDGRGVCTRSVSARRYAGPDGHRTPAPYLAAPNDRSRRGVSLRGCAEALRMSAAGPQQVPPRE